MPIRLRLTFAVAATLAVVLAAVGAFVYARVQTQLDHQINAELRDHVSAVSERLQRAGTQPARGVTDPLAGPGPPGTQVLGLSGRPLLSTPAAGRRSLLSAATLRRVLATGGLAPRRTGSLRLMARVAPTLE